MKISKILALSAILLSAQSAMAAYYLVDASAVDEGSEITYREMKFTVGSTAFDTFESLNAKSPEPSSIVYVAPGTYTGATIDTYGLKLIGANAYQDRTATRGEESVITGELLINNSAITVNGFKFTDGGRIVANTATNESPQHSIKIEYNVFTESTVTRKEGVGIVAFGYRCNNATANESSSQCKYSNCTIAHNDFMASETQYANSVSMFSMYGTTTVSDNYFYEGGDAIHVGNSRGNINIDHNTFSYIGNITSSNPDGNGEGSFCVYADRNGQAGTTNLNIQDNVFDHCYGRASYMALLRIYQGTSGATSCVPPVGYLVNINRNSFTNKTSASSNSNQFGENVLLYSDQSTTGGIIFNVADNHYDNRFYKMAKITLRDGLGQRDFYSNSVDQFTIAGRYSTMGKSVIDDVDISYHLKAWGSTETTVIQSLDIDPVTGDIYYLQLMRTTNKKAFCTANGLDATTVEPLTLTRIPCTKKATKTDGTFTYSTSTETMSLAKTGHGIQIAVFRDHDGQLWILTGAKGDDKGTANDISGPDICKFKFKNGEKVIADGRSNSAISLTYHTHPEGLNNCYADIDAINRYICWRSTGTAGIRQYCIYDLDDFLEGKNTFCGRMFVEVGTQAIVGTGEEKDNGYLTWAGQAFALNGDYIYALEGESKTSATAMVSGQPPIVVQTFNWRTGQSLVRKVINYGRINNMAWGEPEAMTIRPDVFGNATMYLGITNNGANGGNFYVFKFHVDRHIDSSGNVIGDDTATEAKSFDSAQYSGIKMLPSESELSFEVKSVAETQSKTVKISRTSSYMFGTWTACITGNDGAVFDVELTPHSEYSDSFEATVNFTPDGLKTAYSAMLRLSSPNADDIMIPLAAYVAVPKISVDVESLDMVATYNSYAEKEITVTGSYLKGDITLAIEGANAEKFELSQYSISQADGSAKIEVKYTPVRDITHHTASIRISSPGCEDVVIPINAESTEWNDVEEVSAQSVELLYDGEVISLCGAEAESISVYNVSGAVVARVYGRNAVNVSGFATGVYLVSATDVAGNVVTKKIVK